MKAMTERTTIGQVVPAKRNHQMPGVLQRLVERGVLLLAAAGFAAPGPLAAHKTIPDF
jgi:hypothetical protein